MTRPLIATRKSTADQSFEETYQEVYSHGLESIYALETVDLKTVKPLSPSSLSYSHYPRIPAAKLSQLTLDFAVFDQFPNIFQSGEIDLRKALSMSNERILNFWKVVHVCFFAPWIARRGGLVHHDEIIEKLEMVAVQHNLVPTLLKRIKQLDTSKRDPFSLHLLKVEPELYVVTKEVQHDFQLLVKAAESYLYGDKTEYELRSLIAWIERELAKEWKGFPEGFVYKTLSFSGRFILTKTTKHQLIVHLA